MPDNYRIVDKERQFALRRSRTETKQAKQLPIVGFAETIQRLTRVSDWLHRHWRLARQRRDSEYGELRANHCMPPFWNGQRTDGSIFGSDGLVRRPLFNGLITGRGATINVLEEI